MLELPCLEHELASVHLVALGAGSELIGSVFLLLNEGLHFAVLDSEVALQRFLLAAFLELGELDAVAFEVGLLVLLGLEDFLEGHSRRLPLA